MTPADAAYARTRSGSHEGFSDWVRVCEMPIRWSLRTYAATVDVEAVLQEALLRMWTLAPTLELQGENASLRFAITVAKNLAKSEAARRGFQIPGDPPEPQGGAAHAAPPADPPLARLIQRCFRSLPPRPRESLLKRLDCRPDDELAAELGMRKNTFVQNIVRARRLLAECLERGGVALEEYLA